MHRYEMIEVVSFNKNRDLKNWYNSNIKSLAKLLNDNLKTENTLKAGRDNSIDSLQVEIPRKAVSK
jgi:hypothetical protein